MSMPCHLSAFLESCSSPRLRRAAAAARPSLTRRKMPASASAHKRPRDEGASEPPPALRAELLVLVAACVEKDVDALTPQLAAANASLLDCGLTSSSAAALRARVYRQLGAEVPSQDYLNVTFAALLKQIERAQEAEVGATLPELGAAGEETELTSPVTE